jgi:hypothetical protein
VKKKSPTVLSLDFLNKCGWTCQIVEKWNSFASIRQDCFGFGDILAYKTWPKPQIALIQTTTAKNINARRAKILASPHYPGWKRAGGIVILHGWGKNGCEGGEL